MKNSCELVDEVKAGELAIKHIIRGFDAIHLAAALEVRNSDKNIEITFCSFDDRQNDAVRAEGLTTVEPEGGKSAVDENTS